MRLLSLAILVASLALGGCTLLPRGAKEEQQRVEEAGRQYAGPFEKRALPDVPANPEWRDLLHRAFLANGDLEAAYHQWAAATARIQQAATWPNVNLNLSFEYMFSDEKMKSWDRTTIGADLEGTELPVKTAKGAKVALADARAASARFRGAKFALQRQVLLAWTDYALAAEKLRIQRENVRLLEMLVETAASRVQAGAAQQDLLKARIELQLAQNELANLEAELPQMRAMLNAMLARDPGAELAAPERMPASRPIPADDALILAMGVGGNAELSALAREVEGRRDALELARMRFLPDISPMAALTGDVSQMLGAMVMVPTAIPAINGAIKEARSDLRRMEAMSRQAKLDRAGALVARLYVIRNAERQIALFKSKIIPAAEQVLANSRKSYSAGAVGFVELVDSQRTLLDVRLMIAEARAMREKALAELEELAGVDVESISATQPAAGDGGADGPARD